MLKTNINTPKNYLEQKRTAFIAAFLEKNYPKASTVCSDIFNHLETIDHLSENEQKAVNQVLVFIKKYNDLPFDNEISVIKKKISKKIASIVRYETKHVTHTNYKDWTTKTGLNKNQLHILFRTTNVLQLTRGCSNFCRRCNEWALPGVRAHFSFDAVKEFTRRLFDAGNGQFIYYGASDPLDWEDGKSDIRDITNYLEKNNYSPDYGLLTKLPVNKSGSLETLSINHTDIAVSVTNQNRHRVKLFEKKTGILLNKQHDFDDLLIPAGLDEDFSSAKASITDSYGSEITPDGAFQIIPAFTSVLNLTGQHRIPVDKNTVFFLKRKTGRMALPVEYFKPFEAIDLNGRKIRLKRLFSVQIENIILDSGDVQLTPPGMMSLEEFFTTFEINAVLKRKSIIPSIIKEYKKDILDNISYKQSDAQSRSDFKEKLKRYLVGCSLKKMLDIKKSTFSYFLSDISDYLKNNPEKAIIISHLKRKEKETLYTNYRDFFTKNGIEAMLEKNRPPAFIAFKILVLRLLTNPEDDAIHEFINSFKAYYDENTDMYLS